MKQNTPTAADLRHAEFAKYWSPANGARDFVPAERAD